MRTFAVIPSLPAALERLRELATNLRWAWDHDTIALFRRLDADLWETCGHNPVLLLGRIDQAQLEAAATDEGFLAHQERVCRDFDAYMTGRAAWFGRTLGPYAKAQGSAGHQGPQAPLVAYCSAEFGLTECLSIFAGGLGILAGDHLKSASDLGIPLAGVGLLYQQGYFRQYLNEAGWQKDTYETNDFSTLPLTLERQDDGQPLAVQVALPGRQVVAQVWRAQVGRVPLYLLDTNIPANAPADRDITDQLYGGDREMRLKQEMLLGIGGYRALVALQVAPAVYHMNEGHAAFLALERVRHLVATQGLSFAEAREAASAGLVFTTHTPVAAGHDYFPPDLMDRYFSDYSRALGISRQEFLALGRRNPADDSESFGMTTLALRLAAHRNGVSRLHGAVTRQMWQGLWPGVPADEIPIGHVTNAVHFRSWISEEMNELYDRYLGPRWREEPADQSVWLRVARIPDEELWRTHERRRERLVAFARRRLRAQLARRGAPQAEIEAVDDVLDPEVLTIGFGRRFATYKRATLLLRDPERLGRILNHPERPVQVVFAGKAHPGDDAGKALIRDIVALARQEPFRRRLVFLEEYDMAAARYLVGGADVWLNTPRRPLEASGTSGMKAAANGALNLSTLDGWWDEAWWGTYGRTDGAPAGAPAGADGGAAGAQGARTAGGATAASPDGALLGVTGVPATRIGWAIGRGEAYASPDEQDRVEAEALYDLLEWEVVPTFYVRGDGRLPHRWTACMKASIGNLCHFFNTHRMAHEYTERFYLPAAARFWQLMADAGARARSLAAWSAHLQQNWPRVGVEVVDGAGAAPLADLRVGSEVRARARVALGTLTPDDVAVELYLGRIGADGEIVDAEVTPMRLVAPAGPAGPDGPDQGSRQGSRPATGPRGGTTGPSGGTAGGAGEYLFEADAVPCRKSGLHGYTVRVVPRHPDLVSPFLPGLIVWARLT